MFVARPRLPSSASCVSRLAFEYTIRQKSRTQRAERPSAVTAAKELGFDTVVVDTAGRLHVDDELMKELESINAAVDPSDVLYVADAMTGQDAIKSAGEFHRRSHVTGLVLTKMGWRCARWGRAVSCVGGWRTDCFQRRR